MKDFTQVKNTVCFALSFHLSAFLLNRNQYDGILHGLCSLVKQTDYLFWGSYLKVAGWEAGGAAMAAAAGVACAAGPLAGGGVGVE